MALRNGVGYAASIGEPGNLVAWDDLRFPASAINPPGGASDAGIESTTGCLLFDAAGTEVAVMQVQLPHSWAEGTPIVPHVHWQKTTSAAGNVYWQLEYKWSPINAVMDANYTTLATSTPVAGTTDTNTANKHLLSSFGEISTVGKKVSDMLLMTLSRVGGNGADTYGADARLLEFDIHYMVDSHGSEEQFTKGEVAYAP